MLVSAGNLSFGYARPARVIDDVSLDIERGEVVGFIGPNGAGKTTLLKLLTGTLKPDAGHVQLDGVDVQRISRRSIATRVAVVPQDTGLAFDYTVLEMVLMGRYAHLGAFEIEGPADLRAAGRALATTGTSTLASRPFRSLSGGERQRVSIASALAQIDVNGNGAGSAQDSMLVLDEPTASLDLKYQFEIAQALRRLHDESKLTILLSTHDLRFAASVCTRVVLLSGGKTLADGPPAATLTAGNVGGLFGIPEGAVSRDSFSSGPGQWPSISKKSAEIEDQWPGQREKESRLTAPLNRSWSMVAACFAAMVAAVALAPFIGSTALSFARVFDTSVPFAENTDAQIFFIARLPRALAAALVGGTLAAAGVVFQGLLRNPLATPYTLGVSAGASLGAMIAITFGATWIVGGVATASLGGAMLAVAVVYALAAARHRGLSTTVLLLAGVTLNAFFSALILFVQYAGDFAQNFRALRWLMGDVDVASYEPIVAALPLVALAFGGFIWLARPLNLLSVGSEAALARGLDVNRAQRIAFFAASIATGAAVSVGGPIGFIGIIVPHLVRLVVGADHRIVLPASTFVGAAFLVACDAVARTVIAPVELPVGIVTAMIGGPFFLWLLIRRT